MRVLLAHNYFHVVGGADRFYHGVGRVLAAHGHDVAYLAPADDRNPETPWSSYFPTPAEYRTGSLAVRIGGFPRMVYSRKSRESCRRLIADFRPDIAHAFAVHVRLTPSVLDACREARVPVVMSCNDYKLICPNSRLYTGGLLCERCRGGKFYHATFNRCLHDSSVFSLAGTLEAYVHRWLDIYRKNVHTFLFASRFMARKTEEFWGAGTFRWRMLRNPFDSPAHSLRQGYRDYLLYFGRLTGEKGVDVLLRAMSQCPEAVLRVVGDGPEESALRALRDTLSPRNVEFVGPRWGAELDAELGDARFVVVPSVWHENFPYVILQAFAAGKAVIGTDRGGIPELVRNGEFGYVYPAQDAPALAARISQLWHDPDRAVAMGMAAKQWADREFNDDAFYQALMAAYAEVAG